MSIKVMTRVWDASDHKGSGLLLLLALADHADEHGICWPSIAALAGKIRMSPRQTQRMLDALIRSGEVYSAERSGRGNTNRYAVLAGLDDAQIETILTKQLGLSPIEAGAWFAGRDLADDDSTALAEDDARDDAEENETLKGDKMTPFSEQKGVILSSERVTDSTIRDGKGDILNGKGDIAVSPDPLTVKTLNRQIRQNPPTPQTPQTHGALALAQELGGGALDQEVGEPVDLETVRLLQAHHVASWRKFQHLPLAAVKQVIADVPGEPRLIAYRLKELASEVERGTTPQPPSSAAPPTPEQCALDDVWTQTTERLAALLTPAQVAWFHDARLLCLDDPEYGTVIGVPNVLVRDFIRSNLLEPLVGVLGRDVRIEIGEPS